MPCGEAAALVVDKVEGVPRGALRMLLGCPVLGPPPSWLTRFTESQRGALRMLSRELSFDPSLGTSQGLCGRPA